MAEAESRPDVRVSESDYTFQARYVAESAWRLIGMQDANPASPSYGCFDYKFWRDKTSEFADARYQEAAPALLLLSLPAFESIREQAGAPGVASLRSAFSSGLTFWSRSQYADGSFDEWYKGERGFAATEFTTIAYGLAAYLGDEVITDSDREALGQVLTRACDWLLSRHDTVKANHEAAAGAALALGWVVTREERYRTAAAAKIDHTLGRQTEEGWFPEVGGMDLGYCSVLLDYVMLYTLVTGDERAIPAMQRLCAYMVPLVHPDGTISPEAGLCMNPYVSRIGFGLLSPKDDRAAQFTGLFARVSVGRPGLVPTLGDDLRLARWAYLPLLTWMLRERFIWSCDSVAYPEGWTCYPGSGVCVFHWDNVHAYVSVAGGGVIRIFRGQKLVVEDLGIHVGSGEDMRVSQGYDPGRDWSLTGDGIEMTLSMNKPVFAYPGFLSRLILRVGATTATGSWLLRSLIDRYRLKSGTALNQSAGALSKGSSGVTSLRRVTIGQTFLKIRDEIHSSIGPLEGARIQCRFISVGNISRTDSMDAPAERVTIEKTVDLDDASTSMTISSGIP